MVLFIDIAYIHVFSITKSKLILIKLSTSLAFYISYGCHETNVTCFITSVVVDLHNSAEQVACATSNTDDPEQHGKCELVSL